MWPQAGFLQIRWSDVVKEHAMAFLPVSLSRTVKQNIKVHMYMRADREVIHLNVWISNWVHAAKIQPESIHMLILPGLINSH